MLRPNFTDISRDGTALRVKGQSDPGEVSHILGIVVTLSQKHTRKDTTISAPVIVADIPSSGDWNVVIDPTDGFIDGPVAALGMETHDNGTIVTWADALAIPKP